MTTLIFTTSEGHLSIAKAVQNFLTKNSINSTLIFREEIGLQYYKFFYRYFPDYFSFIFFLSKTIFADWIIKIFTSLEHDQFVLQKLEEFKPEVVINTSFGFSVSLQKFQKKYGFKCINIVPNPRTFFKQDIAPHFNNCVFDTQTMIDAKKTLSSAKVIKTGWFSQDKFESSYDKSELKKLLHLNPEQITFLIVAGSEGTARVKHLISPLLHSSQLQLIVACGNNESLFQEVQRMSKSSKTNILSLPFTDKIHQYMQAADLVIGKAGPNMLFESITTHTPFFATTHIGGLEDGNLSIIEEYKVGIVEENTLKAVEKLKEILANPAILNTYTIQAKKLAKYNKIQNLELLNYIQE